MSKAGKRALIEMIVGPLTARERGMMLGRHSATRACAIANGLERYLPPPPPLDQDLSISFEVARLAAAASRAATGRTGPASRARRGKQRAWPQLTTEATNSRTLIEREPSPPTPIENQGG